MLTLDDAEFVSLSCLKTMHLKYVEYPNEATFQKLVSSCPLLEDLKITTSKDSPIVFRVQSLSLKSLRLKRLLRRSSVPFDYVPGVVIDAPLLCCLRIDDCVSESFIVKNMNSNATLDISLHFGLEDFGINEESVASRRSSIRSFLPGISRVMDMTICPDTFKIFHHYSKLEPLPQFGCMSRLHATLRVTDLKWLLTFFELCPNLISRVLELYCDDDEELHSEEMNQIRFSSVPGCFLSSLEIVHFLDPGVSGYAADIVAKYFLENSANLKKLTLDLHSDSTKDDILKYLLEIPRRSATCQIFVY